MVTASRARVLRAYLAERRRGKPPIHAMLVVHTHAVDDQVAAHQAGDEKRMAETSWDAFYAMRYYRIIVLKSQDNPYWIRRLVNA